MSIQNDDLPEPPSIEEAWEQGYRAGIEAAAKEIEGRGLGYDGPVPTTQLGVRNVIAKEIMVRAAMVRALTAPAAPKAPERGACDGEGS